MSAFETIVLATMIISLYIALSAPKNIDRYWLLGLSVMTGIGLALLYYVTIPLMEWSMILNVIFWVGAVLHLALLLYVVLKPNAKQPA